MKIKEPRCIASRLNETQRRTTLWSPIVSSGRSCGWPANLALNPVFNRKLVTRSYG